MTRPPQIHSILPRWCVIAFVACALASSIPYCIAQTIEGQVLGGDAPIAKSTVTLCEASAAATKQLEQTKTDSDGRFKVHGSAQGDASLYTIASGGEPKSGGGDNPAIMLLTVLGSKPPLRSRSMS